MTSVCCMKSGVALTMPSTLTTRRTRERSPSAAFIVAIRCSPTSRAWSLASAALMSRPTLGTVAMSSRAGEPLPDRYSVLPSRT
ncbi:hypothetical protein D3C72_2065330 [compost metagenome]